MVTRYNIMRDAQHRKFTPSLLREGTVLVHAPTYSYDDADGRVQSVAHTGTVRRF